MPALIGAGITGLYALPTVSAEERTCGEYPGGGWRGRVVEDEALLDPVTAVSPAARLRPSGSSSSSRGWRELGSGGCRAQARIAHVLARRSLPRKRRGARHAGEQVTSKGGPLRLALRVFAEERLAERLCARSKRQAVAAPS